MFLKFDFNMLRTHMSSGLDLIPFLVLVFVHFGYSHGLKIQDCSRFHDYYCVNFANCSLGPELVRKQIATVCGFENATTVKICCPKSYSTSFSEPIITTRSTSTITTQSPIKATSGTTRPTLTSLSTRSLSSSMNVERASKNATEIAIMNCKKYEKYQYDTKYLEPLFPELGDEPLPYLQLNCHKVSELILGVPADLKEFPHMALIGYGNNFRNVSWACGGSLISEKFILSAAHCDTSDLGEAKWVVLGELNITSITEKPENRTKSKIYSIVRRFNHPNYKPPSIYNDITLFELNATVEMSAFIRPACLYPSNHNEVNSGAIITGWGSTGPVDRRSDVLLKARIIIQREDLCVTEYPISNRLGHGYETRSMVCAGDLDTGRDTCPGDSGGPMQVMVPDTACMWAVVGITSFGRGLCGNMESPGIYTKVAHYLDWIQGIVWS